jgi:hypothetical protein
LELFLKGTWSQVLACLTVDAVQQPEPVKETKSRSDSSNAAGAWLTPGRFALVLGLLVFAMYPRVALGLRTFVVRDFGFFAYPLAHFQRESFWRGDVPLWNPYNNCGVPFLAQWNTMPLYPPALIYLVLPLGWSLSFFCLLHLCFAGLGMYVLAKRWIGSPLAAAVAGVMFAFNGLTLNLLMWPSHIATLSWLPWVIWAVQRAWREGNRSLVLAVFCGACQMLAGGPESILLTWLVLVALWLVDFVGARDLPQRLRMVWRFALMVLVVAALAAAQLLPFLDLAAHSQRDQGFADARWSIPARGWANFLVPMVFGQVRNVGVFFQYDQFWTSSYYTGVGALLFALIALWRARDKRVWLLAVIAWAGVALAFGDHSIVYRVLRALVPQISLMTYPVKFVMAAIFAVPLLAGFGLAKLQADGDTENRSQTRLLVLASVLLFLLIAAIVFWAWHWPIPTDDFSRTWRNALGRAGILAGVLAVVFMLWNQRGGAWRNCWMPAALLGLLWLDVLTHEPNQNPSAPSEIYMPNLAHTKLAMNPQPTLGGSRAMLTPQAELKFGQFSSSSPKDNLLVKRLGYYANCNLLDDVPKVNGFFSLYPRECGDLNSLLYGSTNLAFPRLADFMGVSQITSPDNLLEWIPLNTFMPLVTAGQQPVFLDDSNALRVVGQLDFHPDKVVLLPSSARAIVAATNLAQARVVSCKFLPERIDADIDADGPTLTVIAQTYYRNWQAEVDGHPAPLLKANYAFQAVPILAGKHHVTVTYRDQAFRAGIAISGISLLGCLVAWCWCGRTRSTKPVSA